MESAERGYGESLEDWKQHKEGREEREKLTGLEAQEKSLKEQAEILGSAEASSGEMEGEGKAGA